MSAWWTVRNVVLNTDTPPFVHIPVESNQVIVTRLENDCSAGRFCGKFRVIPRCSAAESGAECAELRFRPFVHPRFRYSAFGRACSALFRVPRGREFRAWVLVTRDARPALQLDGCA